MAADDITGIHHIGLIVNDMDASLAAFRRLGFHIGPPTYPALPPAPGAAPEPVGAGNTHAEFARGFIELLALAPERGDRLPANAKVTAFEVPDDQLAATRAVIEQTVKGLAARLDASEGAHILVFTTRNAELTAARLEDGGIGNSGARAAQRPITTAEGTELAAVKFLEIHDADPGSPPGLVPEGRVGAAEDAPAELLDAQTGLDHPNGATGISECVICVEEDRLRPTAERYRRYLDTPFALEGPNAVFDLGSSRLTLTTPAGLTARLPGERPHAVPGVSAYAIEVADLAAAERYLDTRSIVLHESADGRPFIPAEAALGTSIVLQQADPGRPRRGAEQ